MEVSLRLNWTTSCIKLVSVKKNSWVIVTEDSLLKGRECPTCRADSLLRVVCCLPRDPGLKMKRESSALWYGAQVIIHY